MGTGRSGLLHLVREATSLFSLLSKIANCNIQDAKQIASHKKGKKILFKMFKKQRSKEEGKKYFEKQYFITNFALEYY